MTREGFPLPLRNKYALSLAPSTIKQNVDDGHAGYSLLPTYICLFNSGELMQVVINFCFFFQHYAATFFVVGGNTGTTTIGGGDGALEKMEELTR